MNKGKNFSCNQKKEKRNKSDFYQTPYSITNHILDALNIPLNSKILEPCSGDKAIVKVLKERGYSNVTDFDLNRDNINFLEYNTDVIYDYILTNPPFSLALEFIQKSKYISNNIVMLLPLNYLHSNKRYELLYNNNIDYKLKEIYVLTRYPLLTDELREDGKYKTGMLVYAWYIFSKNYNGETIIKWIDNNEDILKKLNKNGTF